MFVVTVFDKESLTHLLQFRLDTQQMNTNVDEAGEVNLKWVKYSKRVNKFASKRR